MNCKYHWERAGKEVPAVRAIGADPMCDDCLRGKPIFDDEQIGLRRSDGGDKSRIARGESGLRFRNTPPELMKKLKDALRNGESAAAVAERFGKKLNMVKALQHRMKFAAMKQAA
jgi:hypothetical protein